MIKATIVKQLTIAQAVHESIAKTRNMISILKYIYKSDYTFM